VAAVALRNARRFTALERVGLRDRETGAYNLAYFVDYAGKEFYKARRYGRAFSLVVLAVDNAEALRRSAGRDLWRRAVRDLVAAVTRVVRDADILARVSEGEYYVLLPETDAFGALMFLRRAAEEIRREPTVRQVDELGPLLLSMGAAAFPRDGEDFDQLLHWARARVDEQRGSLLRRLHLDELEKGSFWELVDLLLGQAPLPAAAQSARLPADPERFAAAQREAAREIARDPRARGLLYVGTSGNLGQAPVLAALPAGDGGRAGDATVVVTLLGPRGGPPAAHPLVTEVFTDGDARFAGHQFLLFLSEHSAYAWLSGPDGRAFHTSELPLVDALVHQLQARYDLQPL
jgi:two-component system cell cycle response regulator